MIDHRLADLLSPDPDALIVVQATDLSAANFLMVFPLLFLAVLFGLMAAEKKSPHRKAGKSLLRHSYLANIRRFLINEITLSLCQLSSLYAIAANYGESGLMSGMEEGWLKVLVAFLALDLLMYGWHVLNHHCDALWFFHRVHHDDRCLNVTTGLRYHMGELVLETLVRALLIAALGISATTLLICQGLMSLFILMHHSNLRLPAERLLAGIFVMPSLHRTHHSVLRAEHDSNYGAVLSIWDRLFGTLRVGEPIAFGLPDAADPAWRTWVLSLQEGLTARNKRSPTPARILSRAQQSNIR